VPPHVLVNSALGDVHQSGGQVKVLRKIYRIERERDEFTAYACARARSLLLFRTCASRAAMCTLHRTLRSLELARFEKKTNRCSFFSFPNTTSTANL